MKLHNKICVILTIMSVAGLAAAENTQLADREVTPVDLSGEYACKTWANEAAKPTHPEKEHIVVHRLPTPTGIDRYKVQWMVSPSNGNESWMGNAAGIYLQEEAILALNYNIVSDKQTIEIDGLLIFKVQRSFDRWFLNGYWMRNPDTEKSGMMTCMQIVDES